ncbi:MAG: GatB/YqeY domain-containing protein [Candidatus Pacebacteria bacterium]|jgi:uncharacterized protein YqeY|nr:GatB/YqeY domain-containing protein [Candidatus Paceibacterota bacterium]
MKEQIRKAMKDAMRAKEGKKVTVLRSLLAAFTNELVAQKRPPSEELGEGDVIKVIKRAAKQRKDSIEQFTIGGRQELADKERRELKIIETYLPASTSTEEITKVAKAKVAEMDAAGDMSKMGQVMGAVMKEFAGNADGNDVKEIVSKLMS